MRLLIVALALLAATAYAQEPAKAPALSSEEAIMVQAVRAVQAQAQAACEALPQVKAYTELVGKANAALAKAGKSVDWSTGKVSETKPAAK